MLTRRNALKLAAAFPVATPILTMSAADALAELDKVLADVPAKTERDTVLDPVMHTSAAENDAHPLWNTVETLGVDVDPTPHPPQTWNATAYVFVHSRELDRATQRQLLIAGHTDGSVRIAIVPTHPFDALHAGRGDFGHVAITLAPDLGDEVWRGLFGVAETDTQPLHTFERPDWSDERYNRNQSRIRRMDRYARAEFHHEGGDPGIHERFMPEVSRDW